MMRDYYQNIVEAQDRAIGDILTLAEIGLPPAQFKPFRKKVLEVLHRVMRPKLREILNIQGSGQGNAIDDNLDRKGG